MELPSILSVGTALPEHYVEQEVLLAELRKLWAKKHHNADRIEQLHRAVRVSGRHLALPLEAYSELTSFQKANDAWIREGLKVGQRALEDALARAGLVPQELDHLFFTSVTGVATPSIEARLMNRMPLRSDLKRTPVFGLGCVAGAAGLSRASDYVRAFPGQAAALLAVELCSLTLQREDLSVQNLVASGLFGDGAAAVIVGGGERRGAPRVLATRSVMYPDTERVMGWDVTDSGFKVVLAATVPALVRERLRGDVDGFLAPLGLSRSRIRHWICHTGGPKVIEAFAEAMEVAPSALRHSWDSLERVGNLSSASVLFVLRATLEERRAEPGDYGMLIAMGPGFCSELLLLQW